MAPQNNLVTRNFHFPLQVLACGDILGRAAEDALCSGEILAHLATPQPWNVPSSLIPGSASIHLWCSSQFPVVLGLGWAGVHFLPFSRAVFGLMQSTGVITERCFCYCSAHPEPRPLLPLPWWPQGCPRPGHFTLRIYRWEKEDWEVFQEWLVSSQVSVPWDALLEALDTCPALERAEGIPCFAWLVWWLLLPLLNCLYLSPSSFYPPSSLPGPTGVGVRRCEVLSGAQTLINIHWHHCLFHFHDCHNTSAIRKKKSPRNKCIKYSDADFSNWLNQKWSHQNFCYSRSLKAGKFLLPV